MSVVAVLEIVRLSLEILLKVIEGIPVEQRAQLWAEHREREKFWLHVVGLDKTDVA